MPFNQYLYKLPYCIPYFVIYSGSIDNLSGKQLCTSADFVAYKYGTSVINSLEDLEKQ